MSHMTPHAITVGPGRWLDITNPDPKMISVDDIALALSRRARFAGFTRAYFTVAQHSWNVAMHLRAFGADPVVQWQGLMHDAHEAYMGDIPTPQKNLYHGFKELEELLQGAIFARFDLPHPLDSKVKAIDELMLHSEAEYLLPKPTPAWVKPGLGVSAFCDLSPWPQVKACHKFLDLFYSLAKEVHREDPRRA